MRVVIILAALAFAVAPVHSQALNKQFGVQPATFTPQSLLETVQAEPKSSSRSKKTSKQAYPDITSIRIKGAASKADEDKIRQVLRIKPFEKAHPIKIEGDLGRIRSLGYFEDVQSTLVPSRGGKTWVITVTYYPVIGDIVFNGRTVVERQDLLDAMKNVPGKPLNVSDLRLDTRKIDSLYADKGYNQAKIYRVEPPKKDNDPLVFNIIEGYVEAIIITGNTRTKDYVIRREMETQPGTVLHDPTLNEDLRRIFNLNYFDGLEPQFLQGTATNNYILQIDLQERRTNAQFSFGGGYSPQAGFSVFTDLFWDNVMGTGQTALIKGQFGRANTYQLKYQNPWMWDKRKSLTLKTWYTEGDVTAVNLGSGQAFREEKTRGYEATIGWPINYNLRTSHGLRHEDVFLGETNEEYQSITYIFGISYDTRDVWFNPVKGMYHNYSIERSLPILDDILDLNYTRHTLNLRNFIPTFKSQTIATRMTFGVLDSPQLPALESLYTRELFRVGGSYSVRGYDDLRPFASGRMRAIGSVEYRFIVNRIFTTVLFVDAGFASNTGEEMFDKDNYRVGKGVGIRIQVPGLGPLRLDFGIGDEDNFIHFNLGHVF